jgi:hypothetical protein
LLLDLSPSADAGVEALLAHVVLSLILSQSDWAVEVCKMLLLICEVPFDLTLTDFLSLAYHFGLVAEFSQFLVLGHQFFLVDFCFG